MSGFSINTVTIDGNLTDDPELRALASGTAVARLRIAHNDRRRDSTTGEYVDVAQFYDVSIFGGVGEHIATTLTKGDRAVFSGRLDWHDWEAQDGAKRQAVSIIADSVIPVPRDS